MRPVILILGILFVMLACRPGEEVPASGSYKLAFDKDSILFDTVFTGQVSITQRLKVINTNSNAITISSIRLGGMANSAYSLIINGKRSSQAENVYLRGNDSLLILATVYLDNKDLSQPFLVTDSILFANGSSDQKVYLTAWGRDAVYYNGDTLTANTTWDSTRARFINKSIFVSQGATLNITKGTKIYATKGSGIIVAGTLLINGDSGKTEKVKFYGPRLDKYWADVPGQWQGITFLPGSVNNKIDWAEISNAETGIALASESSNTPMPQLSLTNTIIKNMSGSGILAYNAVVTSWNCLITNCADYGLAVFAGGEHKHYNNTIANYQFTFQRSFPSVFLSDGANTSATTGNSLQLEMTNNIVWGDMENEIMLYKASSGNWNTPVINYNILRTTDASLSTDSNKTYNFANTDFKYIDKINMIKFKDEQNYDFTIDSTSIAVGRGKTIPLFTNDLKGKSRGEKYDLGAYQH